MLSIQKLPPTEASREYFIGLVWDHLVSYYVNSASKTHTFHQVALSGTSPALIARLLELDLPDPDSVLQPGEPPGVWYGPGADKLGLSGTVQPNDFRMLFDGYHPVTGVPLVKNAGHPDRCPGWDLCFSADKTFSICWSAAWPEIRPLFHWIQQEAVQSTLDFIQEKLAFSRKGKGGSEFIRTQIIAACFPHAVTRELQIGLHTHVTLQNAGVCQDGRVRTIFSRPIYRHKLLLGAWQRAQLAYLVRRELGMETERHGVGFRIVGVPDELVLVNSKRRQQILAQLRKKGEAGGEASGRAALATRRSKEVTPPRQETLAQAQETNQKYGFTEDVFAALLGKSQPEPDKGIPLAMNRAIDALTAHRSHFSASDFLAETLREAPNWGIPAPSIPQAVVDFLAQSPEIVLLKPVNGETRYSTKDVLRREKPILESLQRLMKRKGHPVSETILAKILGSRSSIRRGQKEAVRYLTTAKSAIRILSGLPGTGKTFVLNACCDAWRKRGYRVVGLAPTGRAARQLRSETGLPTRTVTKGLIEFKRHLRDIERRNNKGPSKKPSRTPGSRKGEQPLSLDSKTILLVDESGMLNLDQTRELMELAERAKSTIVLVGDAAQLPPVEGVAPFASLCKRITHPRLTEIIRQKDEWARDAVRLFSEGKPAEAMAKFVEKGLLKVSEDKDQALEHLVRDWALLGVDTPEETVVLASTNRDTEIANRLCQQSRIEAGVINTNRSIDIFDDDPRADPQAIEEAWLEHLSGKVDPLQQHGMAQTWTDRKVEDLHKLKGTYFNRVFERDRVVFTKNDPDYDVDNGSRGTVRAINPATHKIAVDLDDGRTVIVPVDAFRHVRLGYSATTHKSQGASIPEVFVLAGGSLQDLPTSLVQASRAKNATRFYIPRELFDPLVDDLESSRLIWEMTRSPDLSLACDLLPSQRQPVTSRATAINRLMHDWETIAEKSLAKVAVFAASQKDVDELNLRCQRLRRKPHRDHRTESISVRNARLHEGDRIRFGRFSLRIGVTSGDLATVTSIDPRTQTIQAQLDRGRLVTIELTTYQDLSLGYALLQRSAERRRVQTALLLESVKAAQQPHEQQQPAAESTPAQAPAWAPSYAEEINADLSSSSSSSSLVYTYQTPDDHATSLATQDDAQQRYLQTGAAQSWTTAQLNTITKLVEDPS